MSAELVPIPRRELSRAGLEQLPAAIGRAGDAAAWRFGSPTLSGDKEHFGEGTRNDEVENH
jgi:hypothetical protein